VVMFCFLALTWLRRCLVVSSSSSNSRRFFARDLQKIEYCCVMQRRFSIKIVVTSSLQHISWIDCPDSI
jgi:hypothetical protein